MSENRSRLCPEAESRGEIDTQISTHLTRSERISAAPRRLFMRVHDPADPLRAISKTGGCRFESCRPVGQGPGNGAFLFADMATLPSPRWK